MAFKTNIRDPFLPPEDSFGGRGKEKGLNHGGQYDVTYIVDNLNKGARKSAPSASRRTATKRQAPQRGERPFLQSSPPVASPRPTTQEKSRMRNVVGVDDVSVDNENFVNLSGNTKKDIERGLAIRSCVKGAEGDNCNGFHAQWQASIGNCSASVISSARSVLERCKRAQGGDVSWCTSGLVSYSGLSKKGRREYVQEVATLWLRELNNEVQTCLDKKQTGTDGGNGQQGSGTIYGCMDENALNYNPEATYNQDCDYMEESDDANGNFPDNEQQGEIQAQINALFDAVKGLGERQASQTAPATPQPDMGAGYYDPYASQPQTAGIGGRIDPLMIGGIVLVAGLAIFLLNQPKKAVAVAPPVK